MDALLLIKSSLFDPNGNLSNWNKGDPCNSNWTGVLCYNTTFDDNYLHVAELYDFKYLWTFITYVKTYLHLSFGTSLNLFFVIVTLEIVVMENLKILILLVSRRPNFGT